MRRRRRQRGEQRHLGCRLLGGGKIALLLPETKTARYETQDRPLFEAKVKELCPDCEVLYSNADQDAAKQQQQAEAALTNGAKVLVLDPVDAASAGADRRPGQAPRTCRCSPTTGPIPGKARRLLHLLRQRARSASCRATSLLDKLKADGKHDGHDRDDQRRPDRQQRQAVQEGAHSGHRQEQVEDRRNEYDTPGLEPDKAQAEMDQAITSARQERVRRRLRGQRRHRRRRDRRDEGGRHRPGDRPSRARTPSWPASSGSSPASST